MDNIDEIINRTRWVVEYILECPHERRGLVREYAKYLSNIVVSPNDEHESTSTQGYNGVTFVTTTVGAEINRIKYITESRQHQIDTFLNSLGEKPEDRKAKIIGVKAFMTVKDWRKPITVTVSNVQHLELAVHGDGVMITFFHFGSNTEGLLGTAREILSSIK